MFEELLGGLLTGLSAVAMANAEYERVVSAAKTAGATTDREINLFISGMKYQKNCDKQKDTSCLRLKISDEEISEFRSVVKKLTSQDSYLSNAVKDSIQDCTDAINNNDYPKFLSSMNRLKARIR